MLKLVFRVAAWSLAAIIVVLSLVPAELRPVTGAPHDVEHFAIFAGTGLAFGLGYEHRHGAIAILLVAFAGVIEIAQLFVPSRHARLLDFVVDAFALCFGLMAAGLVYRARHLRHAPSS